MVYRLLHADLVILDELGYLPVSQNGGALLFNLIIVTRPFDETDLEAIGDRIKHMNIGS